MHSDRDEARRLLGDDPKRNQFEKIVSELRGEFDTLQRICRILLDDIEGIESRITGVINRHECDDILTTKLRDDRHKLEKVLGRITQHEKRIERLEYVAMVNHPMSPSIQVHSHGGVATSTSVGGDIEHDLIVKGDTDE